MAWLFRRGSSRSAAAAATEQAKREQLQLPASCHKPLHISDFAATRPPKGQAAAPDAAAAEENTFSTSSTEASNKQPSGHSPKEGSVLEFTAAYALPRIRAPLLVYQCTAAPSSATAATAAAAPRVFVATSAISVAREAPVGVAVASPNAPAPPLASSVSHDAAAAVAAPKQGATSATAAPTAEGAQPWQPKTATTPEATATAPTATTRPATAAATPAAAGATARTTAATPGGAAAATATTATTGAGAMATAAATLTTAVGPTTATAAWRARPASAQERSVAPQLRAAAASVACTAGAAVAPPHATPLVGSEATLEQGATSTCAPDGLRCSAAAATPGASLPFLTAPSPSCAPASDDRAPHCGCPSIPTAPPGAEASPTDVPPARNSPPDVFHPSLPTASLHSTSPQPPTVFPEEEAAAAAAAAARGDIAAAAVVGVSAPAAASVVVPARQQPYEERQREGEEGERRAAPVAPPAAAAAEGASETATRLCEPPLSPGNSSRFAPVAVCPAAAAAAGMSGALHVDGEAHATAAAPPTQHEATRQYCQQQGPLQSRLQDEEEEKQQQQLLHSQQQKGGEEEEDGRRGTPGLHHPSASLFFDYEFYASLQERSPVASPRAVPGTASPFPVLPKTLPLAAAAAHVTASTTSSSSSSSSSDSSFPCLPSSSSSAPFPSGPVERPAANARPQHAATALPCTSTLQQQQQQQKRNHSLSVSSKAGPQQQKLVEDCLLTHVSAAPEAAMAAPAAATASSPLAAAHEEFAATTSMHVSSASPSAAGATAGAAAAAANAAAPCMHYLPAHGGGAEPLACRRHHCVHVFPPSELKLFVMEGDAAVAAAAAARREEEETLKHPCPLQLPTHLIYHVYEDMNQWQIDRSVAIEAFHQQQLREAYYVLLCLVKHYGVERVAADRELCLVYHRYTEMRYLLRLLDLDVETDAAAAAACSAAAGAAESRAEALHALRRDSAGTAASVPRTDTAAGRDEKQRAAAASAPSQRTSPKRRASSALRTLSSFSRKSTTPRVSAAAAAARPAALDSAKMAGPPSAAGEDEGGRLTRDRETEMHRRSWDGRDAAAASPQQDQVREGATGGEEHVGLAAEIGFRPMEGPGRQDGQETGKEEGRGGEGEELEATGERHIGAEGWKRPLSSRSESYSPRRLLYMSVRRGTGGGDSETPTERAAAAAAPAGGRERGEGTLGSRLKTLGSGGRLHRRGGAGAAARAAEGGGTSGPQQCSGAAYGSRKTSHTEGHGDSGAWERNAVQSQESQQEDGRGIAGASPAAEGKEDRGGTGGGGGGASGPLEKLRMSWPRRWRGEEKRSSMVSAGSSSRSSAGSLSPTRHGNGPARGKGAAGEEEREEEETAKRGREQAAKGRGRKSSGAGDGKRTFSKSLVSAGSTLLRGATAGVTGIKGRGAAAEAKGEEEGEVTTDKAERGGGGSGGTAAAAAGGMTWGEKGRTEGEEWWLGAEERAAEAQMKEKMQKQHVKRCTALLYELLEEKEAWHIGVDDGPAVRVWSKSGGSSKTALVFKLAGVVESSLICVLSVLNEQDLFKEWVPYFSFPVRVGLKGCVRLGQFDRVDQMDLVRIAFPWPLSDRDLCLQVWAADDLDVTGQYFVRIASCQAGEDVNGVPHFESTRHSAVDGAAGDAASTVDDHAIGLPHGCRSSAAVYFGTVAPPSDPGTERLPCEGLLILQPMSADTVDVTALFLIDPHVSLPDYFQSFMTRVFARMAFHAFRRVCAAAQFDEHAGRRVMRPYLYSFIDNRVRALEAAQLLFMRTYSSKENRQDDSRSSKISSSDKSEHADAGATSVSRRVVSYFSSGSSFACPSSPQRSTHRAHSRCTETDTKKQDGNKRGCRG